MAIQRISVLDREQATQVPGDPQVGVISIADPGDSVPLAPGFADLLRLAFHDLDDEMFTYLQATGTSMEAYRLFTSEDAQAVIDWVDRLAARPDPLRVVVHCHAGISRSSAIALFIAHRCRTPLSWTAHFVPNRRVVRLLSEGSGMVVPVPECSHGVDHWIHP